MASSGRGIFNDCFDNVLLDISYVPGLVLTLALPKLPVTAPFILGILEAIERPFELWQCYYTWTPVRCQVATHITYVNNLRTYDNNYTYVNNLVATLIYSKDLGGVFQGRLGVAQSACDLLSVRVKVTTTQRFLRGYTHIYDNNPLLHTHMIIITKLSAIFN